MRIPEKERRDCPNRYDSKGHKTYGDNIPYYAQGAYFPGDEPGEKCKLTGETCYEGITYSECEKEWPNNPEEE